MNGVHDMGGAQGFGPVLPQASEPRFHAPWERRALALTLAMGATGQWNIDLSRAARESLAPALYLGASYYEIWIRALENLMLERGLIEPMESQTGVMTAPARPVARADADAIAAALAKGSPSTRAATAPALFRAGDRVLARNMHAGAHTRLPRYVRGHVGVVTRTHGVHVFADSHASRPTPPFDDRAHWLYNVVFDARALWGAQADPNVQVSVDAWEPYLEPAQ